jgi:hypothetical protein
MMTKLMLRLRHFRADRRGAVAIMTALALIPILLTIGGAIDYARIMALRTRLQQATDSAALAALASTQGGKITHDKTSTIGGVTYGSGYVSKVGNASNFKDVAENYIQQNFNPDKIHQVTTNAVFDLENGSLELDVTTPVSTYLLGLAGVDKINLSASATAAVGSGGKPQEIAIAFDTTWSMNVNGRKEAALAAAKDFLSIVMNYPNGFPNPNVKVAIVPFNDYVNVGSKTTWLSLPIGLSWLTSTDDIVASYPEACTGPKTESKEIMSCTNVPATCQKNVCTSFPTTCTKDGATFACTGNSCVKEDFACTKSECVGTGNFNTITTPRTCKPAYNVTTPWKGCVGSRNNTSDAIDIADENNKVSAVFSVACPNTPISLLSANSFKTFKDGDNLAYTSNNKSEVDLKTRLNGIVFDGSTYIAPGLLWAWRVLSPEKPVAGWYESSSEWMSKSDYEKYANDGIPITRCGQSVNYDSLWNKLNTWGAQSVPFMDVNSPGCPYGSVDKSIVLMTDGFNTKSASYDSMGRHEKTDRAASNAKLTQICSNIKAKGIKIYTISFMITDTDTLNLLKGCASGPTYYYDAGDSAQLAKAFQDIGNSQTRLRLFK